MALPTARLAEAAHAIAQDRANAAEVVVTVTEKPVLSLHTGTFVQARSACKPYAPRGVGGAVTLGSASPDAAPCAGRATRAAWR